MIKEFTLENLEHLDFGKAAMAFNHQIRRVANDCLDRPADATARKVSMEVVVKPALNDDGTCDRVKLQIQVTSKIPSHRTRVYDLGLRKNGILAFAEDSPENFDQTTIFDENEDR